MLIFGKLFHIFTILGTKENFLKSQWHLLFTNFRLWPLVILSCCFSKYKLTLPSYLLVKILYTSISHLTKKWSYFYASAAYTAAEALCFCLVRPGFCPLLMSVLCHQYFSRGNSGFCLTVFARNRDCSRKWRLRHWFVCPCGETQTMSHIVESCPLTKLNGGLSRGYTLRMKMLFRGWPIMVHDTHTKKRSISYASQNYWMNSDEICR